MPKKTRQEKIIAELRRKLQSSHTTATPTEEIVRKEEKVKTPTITHTPANHVAPTPTQDISLVLKDLRKTFFLAGLAISFEIIVYLLWH